MAGTDVERIGTSLELKGLRATRDALKAYLPDLEKQLGKDIKAAMKPVAQKAASLYPDGSYLVGRSRKKLAGYASVRGGGGGWGQRGGIWKSLGELSPGSRAAIFEFIGSKFAGDTENRNAQVEGLIRYVDSKFGRTGHQGKVLWQAWDAEGDTVLQNIKASIVKSEQQLQAHLNAIGEKF
jgi:hypothetical protein